MSVVPKVHIAVTLPRYNRVAGGRLQRAMLEIVPGSTVAVEPAQPDRAVTVVEAEAHLTLYRKLYIK